MYKKIKTTKNDTWDDISRRIFGTPERSGDFEKLNNNIISDEVIVFEENENNTKENNYVSLTVQDTVYTDFPAYILFDALGCVKAGIFAVNVNSNTFNFSQNAVITDENGIFLKGRIANIKAIKNNQTEYTLLEIKSNAGILTESVVPYPLNFQNETLKSVLQRVTGYFGLTVDFQDNNISDELYTNEIGTSFEADFEETAFHFLYRICQSRGLVLKDDGIGLTVFKLNSDVEEKINLIESECIGLTSIEIKFKGDNLARYYEFNSQYPLNENIIITTPYPIPTTKRIKLENINSYNLSDIAEKQVCFILGQHFLVFIELCDNFSIKAGDIAIIKQPSVHIYEETEFVITEVKRINPDKMLLKLTLPCVYTGILPEKLPLC